MTAFANKEIETYVNGLTELQRALLLPLREAVLKTDPRVKEGMKWGSIAFFNEKNICGYRVAKGHVTLLFMEGASLTDKHGILQGNGAKARTYKVVPGDEIQAQAIGDLVKQCLEKGM